MILKAVVVKDMDVADNSEEDAEEGVDVAINYIFSLIWKCYGPKRDILDYWETNIVYILSYYILSKDKGI